MKSRSKSILTWTLRGLLALFFLAAAIPKVLGAEAWVVQFTRWGYPIWFMYLIGVAEIAGAIGLLVPKLSRLAATGLFAVMVGAAITHAIAGEWERVPWNVAYLVGLAAVWHLSAPATITDESSQ